jgi:hypothetical protein
MTTSPCASATPRLTDAAWPSPEATIRRALERRTIAAVRSREPPSMTMCSIEAYVCAPTLASVRPMKRAASSAGVTIETTMRA